MALFRVVNVRAVSHLLAQGFWVAGEGEPRTEMHPCWCCRSCFPGAPRRTTAQRTVTLMTGPPHRTYRENHRMVQQAIREAIRS